MTPREVKEIPAAEYLAMLELMDRDMRERKRQQRTKKPRKR